MKYTEKTHGIIHAAYLNEGNFACFLSTKPLLTNSPVENGAGDKGESVLIFMIYLGFWKFADSGTDTTLSSAMKKYIWTQTANDITLAYPIPTLIDPRNIRATFTQNSIQLSLASDGGTVID